MKTCDVCGNKSETVIGIWKAGKKDAPAFQWCEKCVGTKAWNKKLAKALGHTK